MSHDDNTHAAIPESLSVSLNALVGAAVEQWRLAAWLAKIPGAATNPAAAPARHAVRKLEDFLRQIELEVRGLDGLPFDAGMAARVIDAVDDPSLPVGAAMVAETLSPMVLWRGQVIRAADVVTRRGTGTPV